MGQMSRNKGARGEREAIALLQPVVNRVCADCGKVPFALIRDTRQRYQAKLYDVFGIPWMALEVKRVENQSGLEGWWRQTLAATKEGQTPVLMYRQNNQPWKVRTRVTVLAGKSKIKITVNMRVDDFLVWFEYRLRSELR